MKKNLGPLDRLIRLLMGNLLLFLTMFGVVTGEGTAYLTGLGLYALITSFISFCPLYAVLGISTKRE
jgi:hypothetical protein